jgi:hypothetical protein
MYQAVYQKSCDCRYIPSILSTESQIYFVCKISDAWIPYLPKAMNAWVQPTFQKASFYEKVVMDVITKTPQL